MTSFNTVIPDSLHKIEQKTRDIGFDMASDRRLGPLLRTLASSKPGGHLLELGTGTGLSTAWIADGMQAGARLITIENNSQLCAIAKGFLGHNPEIEFVDTDASRWLQEYRGEPFDLVFADAWPGKYSELEEVLACLRPGGIYLIDDMDEQPNWPDGHQRQVQRLLQTLAQRADLVCTRLHWATGLVLAVKL